MANIQIDAMVSAVKPLLDNYAKTDADFARDYDRKDKSLKDFCKLFYDAVSAGRQGGHAVFGSDEMLIGFAVHYWHEDDVKAGDFDLAEVAIIKSETKKDAKAPKAPTPKTPAPKAPKVEDDMDFDDDEDDAPAPKKLARPKVAKPIGISEDDDFDLD